MNRRRRLLVIGTSVGEIAIGVLLVVAPALAGRWLLGADLTGPATPVARVAGIALVGLGVGCWPGPALIGMLTYSVGVTLYLLLLGLRGEWVGPLLWPAVALHATVSLLLVRPAQETIGDSRTFPRNQVTE